MGAAAGGLLTDAELIGQASELMALGLGLTREADRGADGGWRRSWTGTSRRMTDTLNTGSDAGVEGAGAGRWTEVKGRLAELEAEGHSRRTRPWRMAMVEAGEAKLERVGKKSEEASGAVADTADDGGQCAGRVRARGGGGVRVDSLADDRGAGRRGPAAGVGYAAGLRGGALCWAAAWRGMSW
jgi:hypothetical protein